ncbi:hypothetical protein NKI51_30415 [Mesorhizobium australicum]|uniref:hypothetical protein n=1 Tax=Mesorhizobium australicum TaxID=536018 RepID=UPI003338FEB5
MKPLFAALCTFAFAILSPKTANATPPDGGFSDYVLAAVEMLDGDKSRAGQGYGSGYFTKDLRFGAGDTLKASDKAPLTMCVAAQMEVLVEALNMWSEKNKNNSPFDFLPKVLWQRLRPLDFRGMIWIVKNSPSSGAGYALEHFGMGHLVPFKGLFPGSFINFNRTNKSGHAGVFLGYIDKNGNDLDTYSNDVAGFKYFSSQGMNKPKPISGLGKRWGFFSDVACPDKLPSGHLRDCGIIRSEKNGYLVGGYVLDPSNWDAKKGNAAVVTNNDATSPELTTEGTFNAVFFNGETTD